jgi:superfamily II DNA or RNA helicase
VERAAARRGSRPVAPERWYRGSESAHSFVQGVELPAVFAGQEVERPQDFEDIGAFRGLHPLHVYQEQLAEGIREVLTAGTWEKKRAIAWLPTGTGKTRVMVETLLMECVLDAPRNAIVWIADRDELCEQAVETFRHVWMVRGEASRSVKRGVVPTLRVVRLWDNRPWQDLPDWPTVVVASVQTLAERLKKETWRELLAILGERAAAVVFDEAHHLVAPSWGQVVEALGLARTYNYLQRNQTTAPPVFGLTATPARASRDETDELSRRFQGRLLEPAPEWRSFARFQQEGFLSHLKFEDINTGYTLDLTDDENRQLSLWQQIPRSALKRTGTNAARTAAIIRDLESRLDRLRSVLVFACSVEHAHTLADVLERRGWQAAALDGTTSRAARWQTIQRFRRGELQVLVNFDLLATGFDAPNVDAVAIARPVGSRVLYAQMIGRGLRGPMNGGTQSCVLLDYRDDLKNLPDLEGLRISFRDGYLKWAEAD